MEEDNFFANLDFFLARCVRVLEEIEQVEYDTYTKAMEKFKDQDWIEIFVNKFMDKKKAWLDRL